MKNFRRAFVLTLLAVASVPASAQEFPTRAVHLVIPYAAGGPTDVRGRLIGAKMAEALGQPVVVENRAGGGTMIGTRAVLQAPADGYSVLMQTSSMGIATLTYKSPGYRMEDFRLIAPIGSAPFVLSANPALPFGNVSQLVAYARANPGKLNNGSLGAGGLSQLLVERLKAAAGIAIVDIPYGGAGPALTAVIAGNIQLYMDSLSTSVPAARGGQVRLLGVTTERRLASVPDIPTFSEQGFPTMVGGTWLALFVPAKTPDATAQRLTREATRAIGAADVRERIAVLGFEMWAGTTQEFETYMKRDFSLWEQDIKRLNLPLLD